MSIKLDGPEWDEAHSLLGSMVYAKWRHPVVQPRPYFDDWIRLTRYELGARDATINALAELLVWNVPTGKTVGSHPAKQLIQDVLAAKMEREGWGVQPDGRSHFPDWGREEEECRKNLDRGDLF